MRPRRNSSARESDLIGEAARSAGLGLYVGVASNATRMRQISSERVAVGGNRAVMRPDSDQRSHFITESANQTVAEAISTMLAFRPSRCLSQQPAPSGGV